MRRSVKAQIGLTRERVVDAALRLADRDGLEAVRLRPLAKALGVTPMAIYRHVRDKSQLFDLMAERLLEQVELGSGAETVWQDRLRDLLGSYLAVVDQHPSAPLLLSRPFASPASLRASEAVLEILHEAGFDSGHAVRLFQSISGMLLGPAIHRSFWVAAARQRPNDAERQQASIEGVPAADFAHLSSSIEQFVDWSPGADVDRLTIELLVGGIEVLKSSLATSLADTEGRLPAAPGQRAPSTTDGSS